MCSSDLDKTWGREVSIPTDFDIGLSGLDIQNSLIEWNRLRIRRADGRKLPRVEIDASLLVPSGYMGPAFLVYKNYRTTLVWNRSHLYALAVGHLSDRLIGLGALKRQPPESDQPLRRADIETFQNLLNARGMDAGIPDGILGPKTRAALRTYQKSEGLPPDGYPSKGIIEYLQSKF